MRQSRYYCVIPPLLYKKPKNNKKSNFKDKCGTRTHDFKYPKNLRRSKTIFRYRFYFFRHKKEIHYIPLSCTTVNQALPTVTSSVYLKVEILVQVGMKRMGKFIKSVNPNSNLNNDRCFLYGFFY